MPLATPVLQLQKVRKTYPMEGQDLVAVDDVDLTLNPGEFVAIMGPSGSGKSTLMDIVGLLDRATSGRYLFEGQDVAMLSSDQLADLRCRRLGFVFQSYNLLARTTQQPTGALDTKSSEDIMHLFASLNAERGITILLVTHEPSVGRKAKRLITFRDGKIVEDVAVDPKAGPVVG